MYILQEVRIEPVQKGNSNYEIAHVVYTANGYNREKKLVSFSNPQAFAAIKNMAKGSSFSVVESNDKFKNWTAISTGDTASPPQQASRSNGASSAAPARSSYETPEERAARQVYIIRQSSLERALQTLSVGAKTPPNPDEAIALASKYTDWVLGTQKTEQAGPSE
jgi:hypothetical protein